MLSVKALKHRFYANHQSPYDRFNEAAGRTAAANSIVLHAGCGADDSIGFRSLARQTIGIDDDRWALSNTDLDFVVIGDISSLPLVDECVDVVAAKWVLEHLRDPVRFLAEVARVLKPGGRLIVLTPNLWNYAGFITRFSPHWFQRWFVKTQLGSKPEEVFRTFYRANTMGRIRSLASQAGLKEERLEMIEGAPTLLKFSPFTYLAGIAYERTVNRFQFLRGLRGAILAIFRRVE